MNDLIVLEKLDVAMLFIDKAKIDTLLKKIEHDAFELVEDASLETATSRKEYSSAAYKVARSKTALDNAGKELVADWKSKSKKVDDVRKHCRDFLDDLGGRVRKPLTDFEEAEATRIAKEKADAEFQNAWDEAILENDLFGRRKEIERKEAEFAKIEADRKAKEEAERAERERKERDERIAKEAAERARREAEESSRKQREQAEQEKKAAEERAAKAEQDRIAAIERAKIEAELAAKRAKEAQELAVKQAEEKAKRESEAKEADRIAEESRKKAEAEKVAKNKAHQKKINTEALSDFEANGIDSDTAKAVITLIAKKLISHIKIEY